VILEADPAPNAFTQFVCTQERNRQVDCALLLGRAGPGADHSASDAEQLLEMAVEHVDEVDAECATLRASAAGSTRAAAASSLGDLLVPQRTAVGLARGRELVLLHADASQPPSNTRLWIAGRGVRAHHHIRDGTPELARTDLGRLARILTGNAVGLVLGGGGARGLAHLGVIRAMHEQSLPIDFIGGTSQGGLTTALWAHSLDRFVMGKQIAEFAASMGSAWSFILDLTLPVVSYFSGAGLADYLQRSLGDTHMEDMWISSFIMTTDVTNSAARAMTTGLVRLACQPAVNPVGVFAPSVAEDGALLVDGGYSDNLPVAAMRRLYSPAIIVACDVEDKDRSQLEVRYPSHTGTAEPEVVVSGWSLLWRRLVALVGGKPHVRVPGSTELNRDIRFFGSNSALSKLLSTDGSLCDIVYIRPCVQKFQLMQYHDMAAIQALGYAAAKRTFTSWFARARAAAA
jgi:lysophospholipid hydrolase